ncbi:hypothetical protein QQX98_009809 [Neonectria punicea]|uniref:F-box domain-containing protein n=1 Tax=Neonectria punicea TaxID=979145 RepID=A0ABR1GRI4_9HYPO
MSEITQHNTFSSLPHEILRLICSQLCTHCFGEPLLWTGQEDDNLKQYELQLTLLDLCTTSKLLWFIAQPILHHRIVVPAHCPFPRLVRQLDARPDLALSVKQFSQNDGGDSETFHDLVEFQALTDAARRLQMDSTDDPEFTQAYAEVASPSQFCMDLFIALCPNLTTMSLCISDSGYYGLTTFDFLANRFENLGDASLPQLRHLRFINATARGFVITNQGVGMMIYAAPNLEQLIFRGTPGVVDRALRPCDIAMLFPKLPLLRALEFQDCAFPNDLPSTFIQRMIKYSPHLEYFRYRAQHAHFGEYVREHLTSSQVLEWLQPRQDVFKYLDINLSDLFRDVHASQETHLVDKQLLANLTHLETLRLDETLFCTHFDDTSNSSQTCLTDVVPKSIKNLVVGIFDESHVWRDLAGLADMAADNGFPNLKYVKVYWNIPKHNQEAREQIWDNFDHEAKRNEPRLRERFAESAMTFFVADRAYSVAETGGCMLGVEFLNLF